MINHTLITAAIFIFSLAIYPTMQQDAIAAISMPLVKVINGIPFTYDHESHKYVVEVITPYHTDETLHE